MNPKHIYWFAPYNPNCPSTRYRGIYPLEHFNSLGISNDFVYPERGLKNIFRFLLLFFSILFFRRKDSLIVFQKIITDRYYANMLKLLLFFRTKNTLYDFDDAEYLRNPDSTLNYFLRKCQIVTVGSQLLKEYALKFNSNVHLLTSPVYSHSYQKKKRNSIFTVGWVGDFGNGNKQTKEFSHKTSLYSILFPALKELQGNLKLILIGVKEKSDIPEIVKYFKNSRNIEVFIVEKLNWEKDMLVYKDIQGFDVGVSPMVDHEFNRAKSAFKAKQYLSCGVPVIASDIGETSKFVIDEYNGILCNSVNAFKQAIEKIIYLPNDKYLEMCSNAYDSRHSFSVESYCNGIIGICNNN
jgi:glycosyltransferase involved in cell wall biosynthesis